MVVPASNGVEVISHGDFYPGFQFYQSSTLSHLDRYPRLLDFINYILSFTIVSSIISMFSNVAFGLKRVLIDSSNTPRLIGIFYDGCIFFLRKMDDMIHILVLRDGLDMFYTQLFQHNNRAGLWIVYFLLDYTANVLNFIIREVILKPFHSMRNESPDGELNEYTQFQELPHIKELANTTRTIGRGVSKLNSDYIRTTKERFGSQCIKPINERVESTKSFVAEKMEETKTFVNEKYDELVKPHYDSAYKTFSENYEGNFTYADSIPRSIISTGVDLSTITLGKLKGSNSKPSRVTKQIEKKLDSMARNIAERTEKLST